MLYRQEPYLEAARRSPGWIPIAIPSKFRLPYKPERAFHYCWLRAEFEIVDNPINYYGITLGRINHTYTIYVNNYLIDVKTPPEIANLHYPESFMLPRGLLKTGKNEIFLYLGVYSYEYGGLPDGVYIQPKIEYRRLKNFQDLVFNQLPIGILLLLAGSILLMAAVMIFYGGDRLFLYEILVQVLNALYIITIFSPYKLVSLGMIPPMLMMAIPLFAVLFLFIIQALYRVELYEYSWIIHGGLLVLSGAVYLLNFVVLDFYFTPLYGLIVVSLFIPYAVYMTLRINRIRPDRFKCLVILVLVSLLAAGAILEEVLYMTGSRYSLLVVTYFSPFVILGFAVLGSREYQRRMIHLKVLYDQLHIQGQKADQAKKKVVTDTTGEKLKSIIAFINENYRSDISREGLAAAVGMNPNYFSSQFKEFTGKKINDYINELRVNEAMDRLKDKNIKIIDAALATGFDSLSTFNRAFKNCTGKTPTEYRAELYVKNN
ncbi:MAG TPA: AraC family transcriptional regulator [Spirochaetota bacterium]|nr:AraC family transcriptional regulator [Spirochaetota bacterium]HPC41446.1 AraC family transcriptional regulator [Spirochaetota bacterium]HPL19014.1 AraC family transcriptional regulator [Spirochaetota bacterium]HQF09171.1 AraC family transcriptional regulator [Spirochaetota bacterium]HQH97712.1 AraC family transcriptional regulator [Spirochaetota bacterium]